MRVGSLEIVPILDGTARMPAREILRYTGPNSDPWAAHQQFLDGEDIVMSLGGFLLRSGDRLALVDCGIGPVKTPPFDGGLLVDSLRAVGVETGDITDVLFTHLHYDHVGWATQQGRIVFENATYRCHRDDWLHFVNGTDDRAAKKLEPLTDRMEFWESDGNVLPGLDVQGAPGHTPGSTIMVVSNGGERAMLLGDVVHCPIELVEDDWQAVFDVDAALAQRTRTALARELEGSNVPIAAAHFPGLQFGRLLQATPRRGWLY